MRGLPVAVNFRIVPASRVLKMRDFADQRNWVESKGCRGQNE